jgi:hypothetical protein
MRGALPLPLWAVALVFAIVTPLVARALAVFFERLAREHSRRILAQLARVPADEARSPIDDASGTD